MVEVNYTTQEISVKIVYYGPGRSGKTTNLEVIHAKTPENNRGNLTAISTEQDRTLFFDYMPLEIGRIGNFQVKLRLFTVPGQVYYNHTRKVVLRCVDGVVFVADSQKAKKEENFESLENLRLNLLEQGEKLEELPLVLQYNKRDLGNIFSIEEMEGLFNLYKSTAFPAIAPKGDGVFPCLKQIANLTMLKVEALMKQKPRRAREEEEEKIHGPSASAPVPAPAPIPPAPVPTVVQQPPNQHHYAQPVMEETIKRIKIQMPNQPANKAPAPMPPSNPSNTNIRKINLGSTGMTPPHGLDSLTMDEEKHRIQPLKEQSKKASVPAIKMNNLFRGRLSESSPDSDTPSHLKTKKNSEK